MRICSKSTGKAISICLVLCGFKANILHYTSSSSFNSSASCYNKNLNFSLFRFQQDADANSSTSVSGMATFLNQSNKAIKPINDKESHLR